MMEENGIDELNVQSRTIKKLLQQPLEAGATWYLVDCKWFNSWKSYVGYDSWSSSSRSSNPGPIDNCHLLTEGSSSLKTNLLENLDYVLVPEEAWNNLVEWYSVTEGQEPLNRNVIKQGFSQICKVEVYLVDLKLCRYDEADQFTVQYFSYVDTLEKVVTEMRRLFNIDDNVEVRLLSQYLSNMYEPLATLSKTIEGAGLGKGQTLLLECRNKDGSWPRQTRLTSTQSSPNNKYFSNSSSLSSYTDNSQRDGISPGLCGLSNLGNTCFMNSALQCMSNVPTLTKYMLSGRWRDELNVDNPLGMRGNIASTYAALIETIWSGKHSCAVPRHFKVAVGQFKPEFSGYQQQDSQELMAFLLDGLHEDLNRIRKKPYVEVKEAQDRPDEVVAAEAWHDYKLRNDSIIVDVFHGMLKSTLVCPDCSKLSIKFDPFCYLSLPLPHKKDRQIGVFFVPLDPSIRPRQFKLTVPKNGCIEDLCKAISSLTQVAYNKLVVVDVYNNRFHKVFLLPESLSHISERDDIYIFQVPVTSTDDPDTAVFPVYMREKVPKRTYSAEPTQLFGLPLLVAVPRKQCDYNTLYNCTLAQMARYVNSADAEVEESTSGTLSENSSATSMNLGDENVAEGKPSNPLNNRLFELHVVNSYGYTEVDKLTDDGTPLKLDNNWYLSADWTAKSKNKHYNDREAKAYDVDTSFDRMQSAKKKIISLADCLELFTSEELLGEHDLWYCPHCKKHQQATKKFDLWDLPQFLVIHLKRFSYSRYNRDKLDTLVDFPVRDLDMSPFLKKPLDGPLMYNLLGVCNHYGGLGGGHYTAYAKNIIKNQWFDFDDSRVSPMSEEDVVTKAAYVLVYQRSLPANGLSSS